MVYSSMFKFKFTALISKHAQERNPHLSSRIVQWIYDNIENPDDEVTPAFSEYMTQIVYLEFKKEEDYNLFKLCFGKDVILEQPMDSE